MDTTRMDLRQMRYVLAVAEELHFGRAAERLMIAQPPLSQQIKKLEGQIGVELFRRTKRRVEITAAGKAFVEEARRTLEQADTTVRAAQRAARGEEGRLVIGYAGSAGYQVLPRVLTRFRRQYPGVDVQLREMTTGEQVTALLARRIDAGFVRPPLDEPRLEVSVLMREDFVAVLPRSHRLARGRRVALGRLAAEPFVLFPRHLGPRLYDPILAACQRAGFSPTVAQEAMHVPTIVSLVAAGVGVALLPDSVRALRWSGVAYRPLEEPTSGTAIALAWRMGEDVPVVRMFAQLSRRIFYSPT